MIKHLNGDIWSPFENDISKKDIEYAHINNIKVVPWGSIEYIKQDVNDKKIKQLIEWNVDGIITDRPDIVINLLH